MNRIAVIAIGGNSLVRDDAHQAVEDQYDAICETAKSIAGMIEQGYEVIITHGNGPQVGFILRRSDIAHEVAKAVEQEQDGRGMLICGTGIGMSITANRHAGIRAALCTTELHAKFARRHNNANILCLGARMTGVELAKAITEAFLTTEFEGGRHQRRIDKMAC